MNAMSHEPALLRNRRATTPLNPKGQISRLETLQLGDIKGRKIL
jgi:hypothetical protein